MAKTRVQKETEVESLTTALNVSKLSVLTDYRGLDVATITELRNKLREANISYKIVKNTLVKLALADTKFSSLATDVFTGPMAIAFGTDEVEAARIIEVFGRDHGQLEIIGAINADGELMSSEQVKALAKLPTRDQLTATVVGTIAAPVTSFVRVLNGNLVSLCYVLRAIGEQKTT